MAFIEKKDPIVLNIKLTSKGRELLSSGSLDFKYYGIGDSEVDYDFNAKVNAVDSDYTAFNSSILRAVDKTPNIISFIPRNVSGDSYNELTNVPTTAYTVENQVESLGFFSDSNTKYIADSNHVKQPDAMIDMSTGTVNGQDYIYLIKSPNYGTSGEEPAVGDILYVKWAVDEDTYDYDVNKSKPRPNLFYRITNIISGNLGTAIDDSTALIVRVDRNIPDFTSLQPLTNKVGVMIYYNEINYTGDTAVDLSSTEYLDESVTSFLENSQCPTVVYPFWNLSIVYTDEIAGVQAGNIKYTEFKNRAFGGFVSYIQNQAPTVKKMGVIHYTNNSPANVYGEGFYQNSAVLHIPTIMWHNSSTKELGTTLSSLGSQQLLSGLNLYYYDLADPEGFVVGKIFPELKLFVIEDQELLFAMSYKSNRSWSLPDYDATTNSITDISVPSTGITVTWKYPEENWADPQFVVSDVGYCHATSGGWQSMSVGQVITCSGVYNTAYCVGGYIEENYYHCGDFAIGCIYAKDYINTQTISSQGDCGGDGDYLSMAITDINWGYNYCFEGIAC